jgi:hypothetical protein
MEIYLQQEISKKHKEKQFIFYKPMKKRGGSRITSRFRARNLVVPVLIHGSESAPKRHGSGTLPELGRFRTRFKDMNVGAESKYFNCGVKPKVFCIFFGGIKCACHSFAYVAHFVFLEMSGFEPRAAVASRRSTYLATHLPTQPPIFTLSHP